MPVSSDLIREHRASKSGFLDDCDLTKTAKSKHYSEIAFGHLSEHWIFLSYISTRKKDVDGRSLSNTLLLF